jgi:hypothetical protein
MGDKRKKDHNLEEHTPKDWDSHAVLRQGSEPLHQAKIGRQ